MSTERLSLSDGTAPGRSAAGFDVAWAEPDPEVRESLVVVGDSNVLTFRDLHLEPGYEAWRPDRRNPAPVLFAAPPFSTIPLRWTHPTGRAIEAFAFIGAVAGSRPDYATPHGVVRQIVAERRDRLAGLVYLLGHSELEFGLWVRMRDQDIQAEEFLAQRFDDYLSEVRRTAPAGVPTTLLGLHPPTIHGETLLEVLQEHDVPLQRFADRDGRVRAEAVPFLDRESRIRHRAAANRMLRELAARQGLGFAEISSHVADRGRVREEYLPPDKPKEIHIHLERALPPWLERLGSLHPGFLRPAQETA